MKASLVYRAAGADREYFERSPTLRSLSKTDGKQAGSGAVKVCRKGKLESLKATEAEGLMGWAENSTQWGIFADGKKKAISQTQRIKMCGNGVIPDEVTRILEGCKGFLEAL